MKRFTITFIAFLMMFSFCFGNYSVYALGNEVPENETETEYSEESEESEDLENESSEITESEEYEISEEVEETESDGNEISEEMTEHESEDTEIEEETVDELSSSFVDENVETNSGNNETEQETVEEEIFEEESSNDDIGPVVVKSEETNLVQYADDGTDDETDDEINDAYDLYTFIKALAYYGASRNVKALVEETINRDYPQTRILEDLNEKTSFRKYYFGWKTAGAVKDLGVVGIYKDRRTQIGYIQAMLLEFLTDYTIGDENAHNSIANVEAKTKKLINFIKKQIPDYSDWDGKMPSEDIRNDLLLRLNAPDPGFKEMTDLARFT